MNLLSYLLFRVLVLLFRVMPFRLIYIFADFGYVLLYYIAGYRKKIVYENLTKSFPEKDSEEIKRITKRYYKYISDLIFEGIKGMSMTQKQIRKRHKVLNTEILDAEFNAGKSVIGVTGHYCNWEWGAFSSGVHLKHIPVTIYKPLSNKYLDGFMKRYREKFNCNMVAIKDTNKAFKENSGKAKCYILIADQSPSTAQLKHCQWVEFLNQNTACIPGPEKYAKYFNLAVYYIDIQKVKRGYYTLELSKLVDNPQNMGDGEITKIYMEALESRIKSEPSHWLWSHRRWKHKKNA